MTVARISWRRVDKSQRRCRVLPDFGRCVVNAVEEQVANDAADWLDGQKPA